MTTQEQIEYLATKVMGWQEISDRHCRFCKWWANHEKGTVIAKRGCSEDHLEEFDPLDNWNHWRQVEEKVMEDAELFDKFQSHKHWTTSKGVSWMQWYMAASLPVRVDCLISAHQELFPPTPPHEPTK